MGPSVFHSAIGLQITDLPEVLLEKVFRCLDGPSLTRCSAVCRMWKTRLKYLQQETDLWMNICSAEIPSSVLQEIKEKLFSPRHCLTWCDWKNIYIHWFTMFSDPISDENKDQAQPVYRYCDLVWSPTVKCMKVSGRVIVTTDAAGFLSLWRLGCSTNKPFLYSNLDYDLEDVTLLQINYEGMARRNKPVNDMCHNLIVTTSITKWMLLSRPFRTVLNTFYTELSDVPDGRRSLSSNHTDLVSLLTKTQTETVIHVFRAAHVNVGDKLSMRMLHKLVVKSPMCVLQMTMTFNELVLLCGDGSVTSWNVNSDEPGPMEQSTNPVLFIKVLVSKLFRKNVVVWLSEPGSILDPTGTDIPGVQGPTMGIKVAGQTPCLKFPFAFFMGSPSAFQLLGSFFAIGTNKGEIYMYKIQEEVELLTLKLSDYCWKYNFPITDVIKQLEFVMGPDIKITVIAETTCGIFSIVVPYKNELKEETDGTTAVLLT